jgi:hypothetical protein
MSDEVAKRRHVYHAEAHAVAGRLDLPLAHEIRPHAHVRLPEQGGYYSKRSEKFRIEEIVSVSSAYTHVAGNRDTKVDHGWNTLTTSVVEGLNILEVVTADRVVAQVSTDHPLVGYVPAVTFLGTRFENLRIAGHPVHLHMDLEIVGEKPHDDVPYTSDHGFIERVAQQYERIQAHQNLPSTVLERYNRLPSTAGRQESIECSLVNQAEGSYPGRSYGHVIDIPHFGRIYLATLRLDQSDFENGTPKKTTIGLTMIEFEMGCIGSGSGGVGGVKTNGQSEP